MGVPLHDTVAIEVLLPLQTNVALVAPLLRLENNHCHIEESEHVLKKAHKYSELIILYEKKGLHEKGGWDRGCSDLGGSLVCGGGNLLKCGNSSMGMCLLDEANDLLGGASWPALQVLVDQSKKANSPLKGHERTVQYLQHLGKSSFRKGSGKGLCSNRPDLPPFRILAGQAPPSCSPSFVSPLGVRVPPPPMVEL